MDAPTELFGRASELADVDDRLRSRRLVTLVGPGGVGKTTTALQAARRAAARFPLGVRIVDLARVDDPDAVPGTFAAQLGFSSVEALLSAPVDQPALVIADNCEHVLDRAADTIATLLEECEQPTVLATSRSPLDVPGESVIPIAPLPLPDPGDPTAADAPSVRLFLERARDAGAEIQPDELDAVVELVHRLDGLPLAIEIAAARARSLSVTDLLTRLDAGVGVLDRPRYRGTVRHRSVTELIQWSIGLLDPDESDLLERLALLHGTFTVEEARRLVVDDAALGVDVDAGIEALVNASLVSVADRSGTTRYRLLDTVRAHALGRLRERGRFDELADRFADRVTATVLERLGRAGVRWDPELVRDVAAQFEDIAEALRWAVTHDADPGRAMSLTAALFAVVQQGRAHDIVTLARRAFERWPDAVGRRAPRSAAALATLATAENLTGNPARAIQLAEEGLAALDRPSWSAVAFHRAIGQSRLALGDRTSAAEAFAVGAAEARRLGLTATALELELANAQLAADAGEIDGALDTMAAARDEAEAIGSTMSAVWASTLRAWTTLRRDPVTSLGLARAALERSRAIDYPTACAGNLRTIVFAHLLADDQAAAVDAVDALLGELRARGSLSNARMALDVSAAVAHHAGHPSWAALAATVPTLAPATVLSSPGFDLRPLPAATHAPLSLREALRCAAQVVVDLRGTSPPRMPQPPPDTPRSGPAMAHRGDAWEISYAGRTVTVRATKGLGDLARLFAAEGRDVHCLDLIGAGAQEASTGDVIDARARREYEQRIRDLQAEVDDAETANDYLRAERAQAELDALVEHLTAAIGRAGRARQANSTVERARSAVTQRIRAEMRHLAELHPELGQHLQHSLRTGTYCSYAPEHPTGWTVETAPS